MNSSPYFTGATGGFGPPSGMAALISQGRDQRIDTGGIQQFADVAEKFKQQQDMGKAADYFVKANPDSLAKMGVHPEQWKTLGARDKTAALEGFLKGQAQQSVMQQFAASASQARARSAIQTFAQKNPNASPDELLKAGVTAGLPMEDLARLGQAFHSATERTPMKFGPGDVVDLGQFDPRLKGRFMARQSNGSFVPVESPEAITADAAAKKTEADGTIEIPDPENPVFGPRIRVPLSVAKKDYPHLLKGLAAPGAAKSNTPLALPKTKAELQSGKLYQTARGPATWDGTKFVPFSQ